MSSYSRNISATENELPIWPGSAPGSENLFLTETITNRLPNNNRTVDRAISLVTTPTLTPFFPEKSNGTSIIICPGGGYVRIAYDIEGTDIARMFNEIGITAFVLKYRLPCDGHTNRQYVPLQDTQRAIRFVKNNASRWNLDVNKVGIMGSSAGGHAAASLAVDFNKSVYNPIDTIDNISAQPCYSIFLYPVISMKPPVVHEHACSALLGTVSPAQNAIDEFSPEKHVTPTTPPAFIAVATDDESVNPENSKYYAAALRNAGVPVSLNIYNNGGHGKGISKAVGYDFIRWVDDCKNWLAQMKLIGDKI